MTLGDFHKIGKFCSLLPYALADIDYGIKAIKKLKGKFIECEFYHPSHPYKKVSRFSMLSYENPKVKQFFALFDNKDIANRSGFDSCGVPALISFTKNLHPDCIEACEAGRFSAYISSNNQLIPCSFEKDSQYAISLDSFSIEDAWNSETFDKFRSKHKKICLGCPKNNTCSACPIVPEISVCETLNKKGKDYEN
jgi:radical SAM protein with 4Fe4S-binding SPASM domain